MQFREAIFILCFLVSLSFQETLDNENESEENIDISDIIPVPYDPKMTEAMVRGGSGSDFNYDYQKVECVGPKLWKYVFKTYCNGKRQSPVDLKDPKPMDFTPFKFMGYSSKPKKMMMKNSGHTAVVTLEMDPMPMISGGGLPGKYQFLQMHWHWGKYPNAGSEHTVNGKSYPIELHLVHWNIAYGSVEDALKESDGLAVLGVFLKKGSRIKRNSPYKMIHNKLKKIKKPDQDTMLKPKKLFDFLPTNKKDFYRYLGSLTTPDCNEIVVWTVFKKAMKIKGSWLKKFTKLRNNCKGMMGGNYRPTQPLYGREIYMS